MTVAPLPWRKSTYSTSAETCVEVAATVGHVLVRNSNHPDRGTLTVDPAAMAGWVQQVKAGGLDDLV
jgi:hypothetical protein